jgi:uncharacterized membrane protein YvbJ
MPQCFRCGSTTQSTDVKCKNCRAELKAFGHAGIELHRATGDTALCETCSYHADDSCDYAKRPFAQDCTLYRDVNQAVAAIQRPGARKPTEQRQMFIILAVIFVILLLAIAMR